MVYPAKDLLSSDPDAYPEQVAALADDLKKVITKTIHPNSWERVGGPGAIRALPGCGALVCEQTLQIHEEIAALLDQMRRVRAEQPVDAELARERREQLVTEVYFLKRLSGESADPAAVAKETAGLITLLIEPESWELGTLKANAPLIRSAPGRILVHHRRDVHRRVDRLLKKIEG